MNLGKLKKIISEEVKSALKEDYGRGIPDFALEEAASDAAEGLRRSIKFHITQTATDPVKQRQMLQAANVVIKEAQKEIKEILEEKLSDFFRSV